jgi:hypothetical protein
MRKTTLFVLSMLCALAGNAQTSDTAWTREVVFQANFAQVSLTNWQGGGQDAIAGAGFIKAFADYAESKNAWQNKLDIGYGLLRAGSGGTFQKTDDDLHLLSKFSRELKKPWSAVALADFQTTMTAGYKYKEDSAGNLLRDEKLSSFMAPGYLITSLGAEYRPSDNFFFMLAPISGKFTFVTDDKLANEGAYGVDTGKNIRAEFGANAKTLLRLTLMENVLFETEAGFFANYKTIDAVDVDWKNALILNANKYINAKVSTHLIYDEDIQIEQENGRTGPAVQFKEVFTIGLQYMLK